MTRTGSRSRKLLAHAARVALVAALVGVMVPTGVPAAQAASATYWVDNVNGSDANAGTELDPFETITYALGQADGTDTIMVEPGVYSEANNESMPIQIFDGETLISTEGAGSTTIQGANGKMLLVVNGWHDGDRLEGFTLTGGGAGTSSGVLINLQSASAGVDPPMIIGNTFSENDAGTGGALVISSPTAGTATAIEVHGNTFSDNVGASGGALRYDGYGSIDIVQNTFTGNTAESGAAVLLRTYDAACTLTDNGFVGNAASNSGGAVYWEGHGSALQHTIDSNTFSANSAATAGGAIYFAHASALVAANFGSYNSTPAFGGFAYCEQGVITSENNYFTGHSAGTNGAVWNLDNSSRLTERNDTLWAQVAGPEATRLASGGLYSLLDITNCIYWNLSLTNEIRGATSVSYTCSRDDEAALIAADNTVGAGMVYAHPQVDTGMGLGMIMPTSPCIDTGNPADFPAYDLFETPRPLDGDGDRIDEPDIGCYESPDVSPPVVLVPIFRFYNVTNGTHFYTDSASERDHVIATWPNIYTFEGTAYLTNPANNTQPLTRLYNKVSGSHFYTAFPSEAANALAKWPNVFSLDGPTYAVNPGSVPWSIPVYRFYNLRNGSHFYTASDSEKNNVIAKWPDIYNYEGPAFWIGQ